MKFIAATALSLCVLAAADSKLGKPLTLNAPVPVSAVLAKPADYVGKTVQVKGKIAEVCQEAGCWVELAAEDGKTLRIKVNDGEIVFPKDGAGRMAIAEGKLVKIEMTRDEAIAAAKHQAEETKKPYKEGSIQGPVVKYQIQGTGAIILSN
jgi:hypothetical protein